MSAVLSLVVALLAAPSDGLADEWCAGRSGQEAELCTHFCGMRPVSEGCHILARFGLPGLMAGVAANEKGIPVAPAAIAFGLTETDGQTLAMLYDAMELAPLPLSDEHKARVAEAKVASLKARQAHESGRYLAAARAFERAAGLYATVLGTTHHETIAARANQGEALVRAARHAEAMRLLEQAAIDTERLFGSDHPNVATTLNNLAGLYKAIGAYAKAEPLYLRSLAIKVKAMGPDHPDVATTVGNLAGLYRAMGAYEKAEPLYLRSLAIEENAMGTDHPDMALTVGNLAGLYQQMGAYEKAESLYLRSLTLLEKAQRPDHPFVAATLGNLGGLYYQMGEYKKAELLHLRSLAISEKARRLNHPDVATTLNNLAVLYQRMGAHEKAEQLHLRSLAIREKALGIEHPEVAQTFSNLAGLYQQMGAYEKAEPLYLRSLTILEKALGLDHFFAAMTLNNLANLYGEMGAFEKAEPLYLRSLANIEKALGPYHPEVALTLNNLASLYQRIEEYEKAERLYLRSLDITSKMLGTDHSDVAASLNNLAGLYYHMGVYEKAETLYLRSLSILEKTLGPDHPFNAATAHNLGSLKNRQNAHAEAVIFLEHAADIHLRELPPQHPERVPVAQALGLTLLRLGRTDDARRWLTVAEQIALTHFQAVVDTVHTDAELFALYQQQQPTFATAVALHTAEPGFSAALGWQGAALAAEMRWRDLRRIEQDERVAQATAPKPGGKPRMQAFREASSAHLRLMRTAPATPALKATHAAALAEAEAELKRLEAALATDHPDFARRRELPHATPGDVCAALHRQGGLPLLDYVRHRRLDPAAKGIELVPHDLAFVVEPVASGACRYHRADLGTAKGLDDAYREWREAITAAEVCYDKKGYPDDCLTTFVAVDTAAAKLRALAWDPVAAWLTHHPRILLVPDGPLASVPFGALPAADGNGYLAERHAFTVLSFPAAAILLDSDKAPGTAVGALVVGDVNYARANDSDRAANNVRTCRAKGCAALTPEQRDEFDAAEKQRQAERDAIRKRDPLAGAPCGPDHVEWEPLQSDTEDDSGRTLLEYLAADLAAALGAKTTLVTDATATEPVVTALIRARRIIHLQTHGYAITDAPCAQRHAIARMQRVDDRSPLLGAEGNDRQVFDPQRLAGLIFAGRNPHAVRQKAALDRDITARPTDDERAADGLLVARDILNLDLTGTLLVTLAACQSGLGMQVTGEGALGLGRAFLVAGARYAVVSHWQVPFNATRRMFTTFYRRVADGIEPAAALQQAQVEALAALRAEGIPHSAFIWGAFVPLVGR